MIYNLFGTSQQLIKRKVFADAFSRALSDTYPDKKLIVNTRERRLLNG